MFGFQECCDATTYLDLGRLCLSGLNPCWHEIRPIGAILLNALMFPYGLATLNHILLLSLSLFIIAYESGGKLSSRQTLFAMVWLFLKGIGAFLLLEVMFLGLASVNLTDTAAGVFAAVAILGFSRKNNLLLAVAGGISVLIRAAYLYPMLLLVVFCLVESFYKKRGGGGIIVLFFVCISPQYWLTYQHTGMFSFLDPSSVNYWRDFHLASNWAGYDTLIPAAGYSWESGVSVGMASAFQYHQYNDVANLIIARIQFYFSSFVPWAKVYLDSTSERIFSPLVVMLHVAALYFSVMYLKIRSLKIGFPLLLVLVQSLVIIPEQRFIFLIQLFLVMFTYLYFLRIGEKVYLLKSGDNK